MLRGGLSLEIHKPQAGSCAWFELSVENSVQRGLDNALASWQKEAFKNSP
jgi:hypothetical protein